MEGSILCILHHSCPLGLAVKAVESTYGGNHSGKQSRILNTIFEALFTTNVIEIVDYIIQIITNLELVGARWLVLRHFFIKDIQHVVQENLVLVNQHG
jgi:hypothetical protein